MPAHRSNMATASLEIGDTTWIFTFMGIDSSKSCGSGIRLEAYKYNTISDQWYTIASVPDTEGRLAASASGINGKIYLIGGYKVFNNCNEFTSPRVDIYDPLTDTWSQGDSAITKMDDHVQIVYKDSLIITISGWSQSTNTRRVQIYDTYLNNWTLSNDISGPGLFGHCGSISGDTIVYLDGVRIAGNFTLINQVWQGIISNGNPGSINWTNLGIHPGAKVYRGAGFSYGHRILFTGGTNNAYNINGIGYNNQPSVESGRTWGYNLQTGLYEDYTHNPDSVMDVREVVQVGQNKFFVVGGMEANQKVSNKVSVFVIDSVVVAREQAMPMGLTVKINPNPVKDRARVEIETDFSGKCEVSLYDLNGKRLANLYSGMLQAGKKSFQFSADDLDLAAGTYLVRVVLAAQEVTTKLQVL